MIRVNLFYSPEERRYREGERELRFVGIGLVGFFALLALTHTFLSSRVAKLRLEISEIQQKVVELQETSRQVEAFKRKKSALEGKLKLIQELERNRLTAVKVLDALALSVPLHPSEDIPQKLWLTSYREVEGAVDMTGKALGPEVVAEFLKNLENSDYFHEVSLVSTQWVEEQGVQMSQFEVKCQLHPPLVF